MLYVCTWYCREQVERCRGSMIDDRRPEEIRRMRIQMGPLAVATASMAVEALVGSALSRGPTECTRRLDDLPDP